MMEWREGEASLADLPAEVLHHVVVGVGVLEPADLVRLACVSPVWAVRLEQLDDLLWRDLHQRHFGRPSPSPSSSGKYVFLAPFFFKSYNNSLL